MKNKKRRIWLIIVVLVLTIIMIPKISEHIKIEGYKKTYKAQLDAVIPEIFGNKIWKKYKLSGISYSLSVKKRSHYGHYLYATIDCKSPTPLSFDARLDLACELYDYLPRQIDGVNTLDAEVLLDVKNKGKEIIDEITSTKELLASIENNNSNVECKSCHRSFQKGSENAKSINRTNMCTDCYNSFKALDHWKKEQPVK